MAQFSDMVITNAGLDMIAQSQAGGTLIFTKAKLGNGQIGEEDMTQLTDIISEKMEADLNSVTATSTGHVEIQFIVDNTELDTGFFVREIGIFAKINETGEEKLYAYTNAGNYTNYLSDKSVPIDSIVVKIDLVVGDASEISFTTDKSLVYVTQENLEQHDESETVHEAAFAAHNSDTNAHLDMVGATASEDGERGMVPKPVAGDNEKFLRGDGTWANSLTQADLLDMIYPVGSIYMSVSATSPNTLFGGTWEQMPAGRVLLAQGSADWGTYNAGDTGGEATHTLTTNEMPSHNHSASTNSAGEHTHSMSTYNNSGASNGISQFYSKDYAQNRSTDSAGSHTHTVTINNTGGGADHNNMQPYIAVYMWKRTA